MSHLNLWIRRRGIAAAIGWCTLLSFVAAPGVGAARAAAFPLAVLHETALPATGRASALAFAPDGTTAYLAQGDSLTVFAATGGAPLGGLRLPGHIAALAIAPAGDRAYAALVDHNAVAVISLRPLGLLRTLRLPAAPSDLALDPAGGSIYVASATAGRLFEFDAASGRLTASARVAGALGQIAVNGYGGVFVALSGKDRVAVLDARSLAATGEFPLPGCANPSGLALDPVGRRLFVGCAAGGTAVVDTDVGFTFERLSGAPLGDAHGIYVRPTGALGWKGAVFFAGSGATLEAVRMLAFIHYADGGTLVLPAPATALAFDAAHTRLWVALAPKAGAVRGVGSLLILGAAPAATSGARK